MGSFFKTYQSDRVRTPPSRRLSGSGSGCVRVCDRRGSSSACGRSPRSWSVERLTTNPHAHRARGACVLTFVQNLMTSPTRGRTPNPAASPYICARHFVAGSALPRRHHRSANAPLLAVPALLRELHDVLVVQSDYEARKHTQSLVLLLIVCASFAQHSALRTPRGPLNSGARVVRSLLHSFRT